jgi:hypothetical protein
MTFGRKKKPSGTPSLKRETLQGLRDDPFQSKVMLLGDCSLHFAQVHVGNSTQNLTRLLLRL